MRAVHRSPGKNRGFGPPQHAPAHGQKPKETDAYDANLEETDEDNENPGKGKGGKKN